MPNLSKRSRRPTSKVAEISRQLTDRKRALESARARKATKKAERDAKARATNLGNRAKLWHWEMGVVGKGMHIPRCFWRRILETLMVYPLGNPVYETRVPVSFLPKGMPMAEKKIKR